MSASAAANHQSSPTRSRETSELCLPCALSVWLAAQVAALVLGATGVELSARWPRPAHALALHEMLVMQVGVASLLFPWLMRGGGIRATAMVITTSWPFVVLAGTLAERAAWDILAGGLQVSL